LLIWRGQSADFSSVVLVVLVAIEEPFQETSLSHARTAALLGTSLGCFERGFTPFCLGGYFSTNLFLGDAVISLNPVGPVVVASIMVMAALVLVGGLVIGCICRASPHGYTFAAEPAPLVHELGILIMQPLIKILGKSIFY
jgi:hypothetical protein